MLVPHFFFNPHIMPCPAATAAGLALLLGTPALVVADVYMHNPPGSNNRNRERNENRNNANRMFDSQNNDKGGYPWRGDRELQNKPDPLAYYEGSTLRVEWTNQHACGDDPTTFCSMVLQCVCVFLARAGPVSVVCLVVSSPR